MRRIFVIFSFLLISYHSIAQPSGNSMKGTVSFLSSRNVYVKFQTTSGISAGDTLVAGSNGSKVTLLKVINLSSTSCLCTLLTSDLPAIGAVMIAKKNPKIRQGSKKPQPDVSGRIPTVNRDTIGSKKTSALKTRQMIKGYISAFSYSTLSNTSAANSNQFRYTLSLDARNLASSKVSVSAYLSFRHKAGDWESVKKDLFSALKIYDLSVRYDINKSSYFSVGRKINSEISGAGATDGIQAVKRIGNLSLGGLAGFRPDYANYGFNPKLLQYGGWIGYNSAGSSGYINNTLAIVQQTNNGKTDRRFLSYFHSSSLSRWLSLTGSVEADLFELKDSLPKNTFSLTSLFFSARFRISNRLSLTGSYDARKNPVYYESFKSLIGLTVENEMRRSYRLGLNYRINDNINLGVESGYRYLRSDPKKTLNFSGYISSYHIPLIGISARLSASYLQSAYIDSKTYSALISKDLMQGKLQISGGYRYLDYKLSESLSHTIQHTGEFSVMWLFLKTMSFSLNNELCFEGNHKYDRVYLQLRKRF